MKKSNLRILVATLAGVLFGFICYWISCGTVEALEAPSAVQIILSRTLIGFAIGISMFKWHWVLHGIIMGLIFSLPLAFDGLLVESAELSSTGVFIGTLVLGIIYGVLIELITSVLFKAKVE